MTVLLFDVPHTMSYPDVLVGLGISQNYETPATIATLIAHLQKYIPDIRGINIADTDWIRQVRLGRVLNYTYGFGLFRDSVQPSIILEAMGSDYLGATPAGLFLSANKPHMSQLMAALGFRVPAERLVAVDLTATNAEAISAYFPCDMLVVKPAYEESSLGIALIPNEPEAIRRSSSALLAAVDGPVLVQEYVEGTDVTVPVVGRNRPACLPAVALMHDRSREGPFIFDAALKASKAEVHYEEIGSWPADIRNEVYNMALSACRMAGLRDYSRLDCRVDDAGRCYFLEINANPQLGLGKASFAVSAASTGFAVGEIVRQILAFQDVPCATTMSPTLAS